MALFGFGKKKDREAKKDVLRRDALPELEAHGPNYRTGEMIEGVFSHPADSPAFQASYEAFLKDLYQYPYIFVALSHSEYSKSTKKSVPLISTKDQNIPTIYIFSSLENGKFWCEHYQNYNQDGYLLGILYKNQSDYQSIYKMAQCLGVERVMLDEGARFINFKVTDMIQYNQISDIIRISVNDTFAPVDGRAFAKCSIIERK